MRNTGSMAQHIEKPLPALNIFNGLLILVGLISLTIIFFPTTTSMVSVWMGESSNYSHGLLLPFIAIYILYKEWREKGHIFIVYPRVIALFLITALSLLWLAAHLTQVQVVTQFLFVLILAGFMLGALGYKHAGSLLFPILLMLTAVPMWSVFSGMLQIPTAFTVDTLLHLTGYASYREGFIIHIPEGAFEVSDVCSGINNQVASITLSLLLAYSFKLNKIRSIVLTILGSVVAFISNSIRIYIVVLSGHYTQMQHSLLSDHIWLGWLTFGVLYTLFMLLINFILNNSLILKENNLAAVQNEKKFVSKYTSVAGAALLVAFAAIGPVLAFTLSMQAHEGSSSNKIELPNRIGEWMLSSNFISDWKPSWVNPDISRFVKYQNTDDEYIDVYLAYYFNQRQNKEIINSENKLFDHSKWEVIETKVQETESGKGGLEKYNETIIRNKQGNERIIWHWYKVGGFRTVDGLAAKYYGLLSIIKGKTDASAIVISSLVDKNYESTRADLQLFASKFDIKIINRQ